MNNEEHDELEHDDNISFDGVFDTKHVQDILFSAHSTNNNNNNYIIYFDDELQQRSHGVSI